MGSKTLKDLVPGDPREIWLLADSYNRMARRCEEVGSGFCAVDDGGWRGRAAEAFQTRFERQPRRFRAMADSYGHVAVALDTYASVLSWAQRQAGEVAALDDNEDSRPTPPQHEKPALTAAQQAEITGVITGTDAPAPEPVRVDQRALALSTYRRALAMLDTVGNESAAAIRLATELIPTPAPALPTVTTTSPPTPPDQPATSAADLVVRTVLPAPTPPAWAGPSTRDDLQAWASAITEIRKRLRWDGLNRLSPRLSQHLFEGHYRPGKDVNTGYHHREGGIDRGVLRVVEIIDGPDTHGVYVAQVRGPRTLAVTTKKSTFFPDSWSRAEVLYAVRHVFLDAMRNKEKNYDPARRRFRGVYRGVRIQGDLKTMPPNPGCATS
ncbi:MAG: putative T7SS-secreted protein [Actinophytocola sp.]|uniref:putative T7SS-secreted protein n=1 Tax=Actinophytocola sp. TaxID=1872138 RepID=UPI003C77F557